MNVISVRDFGATGNGISLDTGPIQAAIDACTEMAGGTVYFPSGDYLTGTLILKDNVTLHIGHNARLLGSTSLADYPKLELAESITEIDYLDYCLIHANQAHHIALTGEGCLDGQGTAFPYGTENYNEEDLALAANQQSFIRPTLVHFTDCHDVTISNLTLQHSASWCCHLEKCKELHIHDVHLFNRANQNNDGFDLTYCEDVMISNCHIDCSDDAIALKEGGVRIVVTNCIISSRWAAIRIGPEALGEFRDIAVSNCVIYDTYGAAIKIQEVEGGIMENISFDNLVMNHVTGPISLRLGGYLGWRQERTESLPIGMLRNIRFSNIQATIAEDAYPLPHEVPAFPGEKKSCLNIAGVPGYFIENVSFNGLHFSFPGGGTQEDAQRAVPEHRDRYPEYHMFGTLPAYGVYIRHAKGVVFNDVTLETKSSDLRPAMFAEDVENLELANFRASGTSSAALIRLCNARQVYLHSCRPLDKVPLFLSVEGAASRGILLQGNDLRQASLHYSLTGDAQAGAVLKA